MSGQLGFVVAADGSPALTTRPWILDVCALACLVLVVHFPLGFGGVFGEQDVARLVVDAQLWLKGGIRSADLSSYRLYISPGYVWLIKELIPSAERLSVPVGYWLNGINLVCAMVLMHPAYILFTRLVGREGALLGLAALAFLPAFWLAGLYGFPSLPALLCLVYAIVLYDGILLRDGWRPGALVGVFLLLTATILLKADVYLSTVALPFFLVLRRRVQRQSVLTLAALLCGPLAMSYLASLVVLPGSPDVLQLLRGWNAQYRPALAGLFSRERLEGFAQGLGVATPCFFALGIGLLAWTRRWRLASLVLCWVVVPVTFWFLRPGDSARHHAQAAIPVALALASLFGYRGIGQPVRYAALVAMLVVNYFAYPASYFTLQPSGRLIGSGRLIEAQANGIQALARQFAAVRVPRKVVLGTYTNPYIDAEVLSRASRVDEASIGKSKGFEAIEMHLRDDSGAFVSTSVRVMGEDVPRAARAYREAGYAVFSLEFDLESGQPLRPFPPGALSSY